MMACSPATRSAAAAVAAASAAGAARRTASGGHLALNGSFAAAACRTGRSDARQRCAAALVSRRPLSSTVRLVFHGAKPLRRAAPRALCDANLFLLPLVGRKKKRREPRHPSRSSPLARAAPVPLVNAFSGSDRSRPFSSRQILKKFIPENVRQLAKTAAVFGDNLVVNSPVFHSFIFLTVAIFGASWHFEKEKKRMDAKREEAQKKVVAAAGKPKIGGPFTLVDTEGKTVTNEDFLGQYLLVYFGFTHCPDVCPEELEKMTDVVDLLRANPMMGKKVTPIFITCDPQRDGIDEVKAYVKDFHSDLIGLTGTFDQVARAAKAYRIYFSAPPGVDPGDDYLVDHSIFFYFMDPHGEFLDAYSREWTPGQVVLSIESHVKKYRADGGAEGREAVLRQREERARAKEAEPAEKQPTMSERIGAPLKSWI
ncbi:MAG: SCO1/SenC-domain-containing protein [Olpidium bornovanus]|uniref:SCO1/SenC-domain-containing protein n=1 Tax=Olpidium bornovanus TaxID=278681 RepID=A0A8H8DGX6_9FUNG|nr:MAG: SCO1/SenC-domain-containing protein [Olpidium bornovanus]